MDEESSSLTNHSPLAYAILGDIESFIDEFARRGCPAQVQKIVNGARLTGTEIGQKPERFTKDEYVWPVLQTLGYELRAEPAAIPRWGNDYPDFEVLNFDVGESCRILGEVKTPNHISTGRVQMRRYLQQDLNDDTVGIVTDGFVWEVYFRPSRETSVHTLVTVDLRNVVARVGRRVLDSESYRSRTARRDLVESGVEELARDTVEDTVIEVRDALNEQ